MDPNGQPWGGAWSFDSENRRALPKDVVPPQARQFSDDIHLPAVVSLVRELFADHPGDAEQMAWPVTREQALQQLQDFVIYRLDDFGPYQDALTNRYPTVFHSL